MPPDRTNLINTFVDRHIVVIGDAMLDSYLMGEATRLCPEAPVPVVALSDRQDLPGGAANTAANLRNLGANVSFLSVIGDDGEGRRLQQILERYGIAADQLLIQPSRCTLVKQRVMAGSQMLVRLDLGSTEAIAPDIEQQLMDRVMDRFSHCDAVLISDYGYGILTPGVMRAIASLQAQSPKLIVADSKQLANYRSVGITVAKPNYAQALQLLAQMDAPGFPEETSTRCDRIAHYSDALLDCTGAKMVIVTLDADGALLLQRHAAPLHIPAKAAQCAFTTGAGDTFSSALTLALSAGATVAIAADLAATAAAIVVAKEGTAMCSATELHRQLEEESLRERERSQKAEPRLNAVTDGNSTTNLTTNDLTKEVA